MIDERFMTQLEKYRLDHPVDLDEGVSMDLAKQMEIEFQPFLTPGLRLDGTDLELTVLRKKLFAVDQAIAQHEIYFSLTCHSPPLITWSTSFGGITIDEIIDPTEQSQIKLRAITAITAHIERIMSGEQR